MIDDPQGSPERFDATQLNRETALSPENAKEQVVDSMAKRAFDLSNATESPAEIEALQRAGVEMADGTYKDPYDHAQATLERFQPDGMGEGSRALAVSLNQAERSERGLPSLSFEQALTGLAGQAREDLRSDEASIKQDGLTVGFFVHDSQRAPSIKTCDDMLRHLEKNLADWAKTNTEPTPLSEEQVSTWRAQRDAIWHKRAELRAGEAVAERQRDEQPAHNQAVEAARSQIVRVFEGETVADDVEPQVAASSEARSTPKPAMQQLGESLQAVVTTLRDGDVARSFPGLRELADDKKIVLAKTLWDLNRTYRSGDPAVYRDKFSAVVVSYTSGELFANK